MFDPADTVPVDAFVRVKVVLVCVPGTQQQGHTVVPAGDDDGDIAMQAGDAVAAQTVAQQNGVVGFPRRIGGLVQFFLELAAQHIRRIVQALRHQHDIHDIPTAGRTQIRLPLHHFAYHEFQPHGGIVVFFDKF
jgi:hypothetical protein